MYTNNMKNTKNTNTVGKLKKFNRKIVERYNMHIKIMLQDMDSSSDLIDHPLFISNIHRHGPFIYIFTPWTPYLYICRPWTLYIFTHHGPFIYIFTDHGPFIYIFTQPGPFILYIHRPWTPYFTYPQLILCSSLYYYICTIITNTTDNNI